MKRLLSITLAFVMMVGMVVPAYAEENCQIDKNIKVVLDGITIPTEYERNKTKIIYGEDTDSYYAEIIDVNTQKVIDKYGIYKEPEITSSRKYKMHTIYRQVGSFFYHLRLNARLKVYKNGSFRQISEVKSTWWSKKGGKNIGDIKYSNSDAMSSTGSFPTTEIELDGYANYEIPVNLSNNTSVSGNVSLGEIVGAGFTFGYSEGGTVYYTNEINCNFMYNVY